MPEFVKRAQAVAPHPSVALWEAPSADAATQFGVVLLDPDGRVTQFVEKSPQPPSTQVALCVYYFPKAMHARIQEFLDAGGNPDAPGYFLEWLVKQEPTYGMQMGGTWFDVGTHEAYEAIQRDWPNLSTGS